MWAGPEAFSKFHFNKRQSMIIRIILYIDFAVHNLFTHVCPILHEQLQTWQNLHSIWATWCNTQIKLAKYYIVPVSQTWPTVKPVLCTTGTGPTGVGREAEKCRKGRKREKITAENANISKGQSRAASDGNLSLKLTSTSPCNSLVSSYDYDCL